MSNYRLPERDRLLAIQEGHCIAQADAYFSARHPMLDTLRSRRDFEAGFDRGFSAGQQEAAARIAELEKDAARYRLQPIETAPKDGTTVLVYPPTWKDRKASTARYDKDEFAEKPRPYWSRDDASHKVSISRRVPPTHWMPIPDIDAILKEREK